METAESAASIARVERLRNRGVIVVTPVLSIRSVHLRASVVCRSPRENLLEQPPCQRREEARGEHVPRFKGADPRAPLMASLLLQFRPEDALSNVRGQPDSVA